MNLKTLMFVFMRYIEDTPSDTPVQKEAKRCARHALSDEKAPGEVFGPFIDKKEPDFSILGISTNGEEIIAHVWKFIEGLNEEEKGTARESMITALRNSSDEFGNRICNQGKTQKVVLSGQGYVLPGEAAPLIMIDDPDNTRISAGIALSLFLMKKGVQEITTLGELLGAAEEFCKGAPNFNKEDFIAEVRAYAGLQEIEEHDEWANLEPLI